jgi:hypothetical protein
MSEETTNQNAQTSVLPNFELIEPKDGVPRIYASFSNITWSGPDLTVDLYKLEQPNREIPALKDSPNYLLNTGRVTMAWTSAKSFHDLLGKVLARYEAVYGPINTEFKQI